MQFDGLSTPAYLCIFTGSAVALMYASRIVYIQLHVIAKKLSIPTFFIATLVVAFCTSIPELYIGIDSALHNTPTLALGNILGSNILGITLITGVVLLIARKRINLHMHIDARRLAIVLLLSSLPALMLSNGTISRFEGAVLVGAYLFHLAFSLVSRKMHEGHSVAHHHRGLATSIGLLLLGGVLLAATSQILFSTAMSITASFALSPLIVGVFALSFSTTFPEWSFGIRSALHNKPELLVADIVGANVLNACGILGIVALIAPISPARPDLALITSLFTVGVYLMFYWIFAKKSASPLSGILLVLLYVVFVGLNIALREI